MERHAEKCVESIASLQGIVFSAVDGWSSILTLIFQLFRRICTDLCSDRFFFNACICPELEDLLFFGPTTSWQDQSPSGTKLVKKRLIGVIDKLHQSNETLQTILFGWRQISALQNIECFTYSAGALQESKSTARGTFDS